MGDGYRSVFALSDKKYGTCMRYNGNGMPLVLYLGNRAMAIEAYLLSGESPRSSYEAVSRKTGDALQLAQYIPILLRVLSLIAQSRNSLRSTQCGVNSASQDGRPCKQLVGSLSFCTHGLGLCCHKPN